MQLFKDLAAALLDPQENHERFITHCNGLFLKALRQPTLRSNDDIFPPEAVALCVCSHLCGTSLESVHNAYLSLNQPLKQTSCSALTKSELLEVWNSGWTPAKASMGIEVSNGKSSKRPRLLFAGYKIFFIPSLLFSQSCARVLLARVEENGAIGKVYSCGEKGFKEAQDELKEDEHSHETFICADTNLIHKYADKYNVDARPPKWLRDSLRDLRVKDLGLYLNNRAKTKDSSPGETTTPRTKRSFHDFRAEAYIEEAKGSSKRAKVFSEGSKGLPDDFISPARIQDNFFDETPKKSPTQRSNEKKSASNWACEVRTSFSGGDFPMNEKICELLGVIQEAYAAKKDGFRAMGYTKAISRISSLRYELATVDDVRELSNGKSIGPGMERKLIEIVTTGRLLQAEAVLENSDNKAVRELCNVWGIGPAKALSLISNGIKSVKDLRNAVAANRQILDKNQHIGLRHYEDLLLRIPREYVAELERFVRMVTKSVDVQLDITVAGSYLRGKKDCGDVDVLIYGPPANVRRGFPKIRDTMKRKGVLTDDLVDGDAKYFGIFHFPGRPHGRVDLFAVPDDEYPFALLTYTGSAIFNRSMRAKARALGYSLSHKGLQRVNRSKHSKTRVEPPIRVKNEREIFLLLDIPYVSPSARSI